MGNAEEARRPRVALLVDGENVSHALAGRMVVKAAAAGDLAIMRVYGNAALIPGWDKAERFRLIHSGSGKNATDLLLTVEAMALAYSGGAEVFCIASSDRDFSHLVLHLREKGHRVIGMGEAKADASYRKAFAEWVELGAAVKVEAPPIRPKPANLDDQIAEVLRCTGGSLPLSDLNPRMRWDYDVKISTYPEKNWRTYLNARPARFRCDPNQPDAKVTLLGPVSH